jgi:hypothetical protein
MNKRFWYEGLIIVIVFIVLLGFCSKIESTYTRKARVCTIEDKTVLFIDETGNIWEWELEEGEEYRVNEKVKLVMFSNFTDDIIEDDEIKKIKKY